MPNKVTLSGMPRTGRPRIFRNRTEIRVLLERAELRALHARAERDGVSVSAYVRRLVQQALVATKGGTRR
jgi:hypothetical protein